MESGTLLLSTAYFAPVEYIEAVNNHQRLYLERFENYSKQTYRNRCYILSANGVLPLVIPVKRFKGRKTPVTDVRPDYSYQWQKLHRTSIESAYRSAPFFEYYFDYFKPFFEKEFRYLIDLNTGILETILPLVNIDLYPQYTGSYIAGAHEGVTDMRNLIHPKASGLFPGYSYRNREYMQVFSDRHGFCSNLSIIDLLFNTGPDASSYLRKSTDG